MTYVPSSVNVHASQVIHDAAYVVLAIFILFLR